MERNTSQEFQKVTSKVDDQFQTLGRRLQEVRDSVLAGQTSSEAAALQFGRQVGIMQKNVLSGNRNVIKQHNKTRDQIIQSRTEVMETICSKLQDLPGNLAERYMSARKSGREIRFSGHSREAMLSPLLLLKPGLRSATFQILSQSSEEVSPPHLYWLLSEFDNLVLSATQEVAAISSGSTVTPFDNWIYSRELTSSMSAEDAHDHTPLLKKKPRHEHESSNEMTGSGRVAKRKRRKLKYRSFPFTLPVGKIKLVVPDPKFVSPDAIDSCNVNEVSFLFTPKSNICSTSIHGRFIKLTDLGQEPRLYAQLNAFNIVKDHSRHLELICSGTLEEIDTAFRVGKISPYDVYDVGYEKSRNIHLWVRILLL
jgi:hypothetical protein